MGLSFYARNQEINTEKLLFVPGATEQTQYARNGEQVLSMRLYAEEDKYIEYLYKLSPDSYMVDFSVITHNMDDVIAAKSSFLTLNWGIHMPQLEKSKDFEKRYTGVYYKFFEDDVENLSLTSDEKETLTTKVQWIDFKQQFFSSILIAQKPFNDVELALTNSDEAGYLKYAAAENPRCPTTATRTSVTTCVFLRSECLHCAERVWKRYRFTGNYQYGLEMDCVVQ